MGWKCPFRISTRTPSFLNNSLFYLVTPGNGMDINPLKPNDAYIGRTAPLTSRRCILYIYSTNICSEYFKHAAHSPCFSLQNAVYFIMLSCLVPALFAFYIQDVIKFKCKIPAQKVKSYGPRPLPS